MNQIKGIMIIVLLIIAGIGCMTSKQECVKQEELDTTLQTKIALYFENPQTNELVKEYRYVPLQEVQDHLENTIIQELLKGPISPELKTSIPPKTTVRQIVCKGATIQVDFSKEFLDEENDLEKWQKIYEVVDSLTEITEIKKVAILVEGKPYIEKERL